MSKRTNKSNHHNKQMHIQVNNTWNKALFKLQFRGAEHHILLPTQHSGSHSDEFTRGDCAFVTELVAALCFTIWGNKGRWRDRGSRKVRWRDGGSHPWHHFQVAALGSSGLSLMALYQNPEFWEDWGYLIFCQKKKKKRKG